MSPAVTVSAAGESVTAAYSLTLPTYGPIRASDFDAVRSTLTAVPATATVVPWSWARSTGMTLGDAARTLKPGQILGLPEDEKPFTFDGSQGFTSRLGSDQGLCRVPGSGILGLGPGTVIDVAPGGFHQAAQTAAGVGVVYRVADCVTPGAYFGNFTWRAAAGYDFGGVAFHGLRLEGDDQVAERITFQGGSRGFANMPPGESGSLCLYKGSRQRVLECELDGRDPVTGVRVASSLIMANSQTGLYYRNVYAHHGKAGMPTFWRVSNSTTDNLRSEYNGSGSGVLSGSQINHELCSGFITHNNLRVLSNYQGMANPAEAKNSGLHAAVGGNETSLKLTVRGLTLDPKDGPVPGTFAIHRYATYNGKPDAQLDADIVVTDAAGKALPQRSWT